MSHSKLKLLIEELLAQAGIAVNGNQPWDIQVHNNQFFERVIKQGSLGLGEAYMENWWSCERIDLFIERVLKANLERHLKTNLRLVLKILYAKLSNRQTKHRARIVGRKHYDLGNKLFELMLDSRLIYSCGYWKNAADLEQAQLNKLELSCQKLQLAPGMRVLDIGCGFGSFAKYAAQQYGVEVVGVTISQQQYEYAKRNCADFPIEIRLQDYRELNEKFDRVVSIGMFEHVGQVNYARYMQVVDRCLKDKGLFLLHTIGLTLGHALQDEWIVKYIFPNSALPSVEQIAKATEKHFVLEDWHNFGADYDKTLMAWHANFNQHWQKLKDTYDDVFYRMWNYYLLSCAGSFRARHTQLWQVVFSKGGVPGGYSRPT